MKKTNYVLLCLSLFVTIMIFSSCEESESLSEGDSSSDEDPVPIQEFFFQGTLGDEAFNFKSEQYDISTINVPVDDYIFEFGGSKIDRVMGTINSEPVEYCYGDYAFGITPTMGTSANISHGKMYIRDVFLNQCSIENEILNLESAFDANNFVYTQFLGDDANNRVEFFYYPPGVFNDQYDFYFSINENTNSTFMINSVIKEESGVYILEGSFTCRMYSRLDATNFKDLKDGKFRIRIKTNLESD